MDVREENQNVKIITPEQCNAASHYWSQILTRELVPEELAASKRALPPFMATMEAMHTKAYFAKLENKDPTWPFKFMLSLESLLKDAKVSLVLELHYHPWGLLKKAAKNADIPEGFFPTGKLKMTFDCDGHIIVGSEKIDAEEFLKSSTPQNVAIKQHAPTFKLLS